MRKVELPDQKIGYFHHVDSHDNFVIELEDGSICSFDQNYIKFVDQPEEVNKHDWTQIRIQASIAAMQGMLTQPSKTGYLDAAYCVRCADSLITELKKQTK